jgi:hypothetical protein
MFKNTQWAVTENGIGTVAGVWFPLARHYTTNYDLSADRLVETTERPNGTFYHLPLHMAEKEWIDIDRLIEAFTAALETHKGRYSPPVDIKMLGSSILEAQRITRLRRRHAQ